MALWVPNSRSSQKIEHSTSKQGGYHYHYIPKHSTWNLIKQGPFYHQPPKQYTMMKEICFHIITNTFVVSLPPPPHLQKRGWGSHLSSPSVSSQPNTSPPPSTIPSASDSWPTRALGQHPRIPWVTFSVVPLQGSGCGTPSEWPTGKWFINAVILSTYKSWDNPPR